MQEKKNIILLILNELQVNKPQMTVYLSDPSHYAIKVNMVQHSTIEDSAHPVPSVLPGGEVAQR